MPPLMKASGKFMKKNITSLTGMKKSLYSCWPWLLPKAI